MEWSKQQYSQKKEVWVPWLEDLYLRWFTKDNKASYTTKRKHMTTIPTSCSENASKKKWYKGTNMPILFPRKPRQVESNGRPTSRHPPRRHPRLSGGTSRTRWPPAARWRPGIQGGPQPCRTTGEGRERGICPRSGGEGRRVRGGRGQGFGVWCCGWGEGCWRSSREWSERRGQLFRRIHGWGE